MPNCRKCNVELTTNNWSPSNNAILNYICRDCATKYSTNWNNTHKQQHLEAVRKWCKNKGGKYNTYFRDYNQKQKLIVIEHYTHGTMKCPACDCSNIKCLTVEHLNKGGGKDRKEVGYGLVFYRWIINNNFLSDLTVLCMNCNWIRREDKRTKEAVDAINHYSNGNMSCAVCGANDLRVLTIDHINGGGHKQKKDLGLLHGVAFYRWLRTNDYPKGYQVLCMNCQWIKKG